MSATRHRGDSSAQTHGEERGSLYRAPALTADQIARYVQALLRELFSNGDVRFNDAVLIAFQESGIQPVSPLRCESLYFEPSLEQIDDFAVRLRERIERDAAVNRALTTVAAEILNELLIRAPDAHLTARELVELVWCCTPQTTRHLSDYDTYARRVAHLATCDICQRVLSSVHV